MHLRFGKRWPVDAPYGTNTHENSDRLVVTIANDGSLWLILGPESGFGTAHHLYFLGFRAEFADRPDTVKRSLPFSEGSLTPVYSSFS